MSTLAAPTMDKFRLCFYVIFALLSHQIRIASSDETSNASFAPNDSIEWFKTPGTSESSTEDEGTEQAILEATKNPVFIVTSMPVSKALFEKTSQDGEIINETQGSNKTEPSSEENGAPEVGENINKTVMDDPPIKGGNLDEAEAQINDMVTGASDIIEKNSFMEAPIRFFSHSPAPDASEQFLGVVQDVKKDFGITEAQNENILSGEMLPTPMSLVSSFESNRNDEAFDSGFEEALAPKPTTKWKRMRSSPFTLRDQFAEKALRNLSTSSSQETATRRSASSNSSERFKRPVIVRRRKRLRKKKRKQFQFGTKTSKSFGVEMPDYIRQRSKINQDYDSNEIIVAKSSWDAVEPQVRNHMTFDVSSSLNFKGKPLTTPPPEKKSLANTEKISTYQTATLPPFNIALKNKEETKSFSGPSRLVFRKKVKKTKLPKFKPIETWTAKPNKTDSGSPTSTKNNPRMKFSQPAFQKVKDSKEKLNIKSESTMSFNKVESTGEFPEKGFFRTGRKHEGSSLDSLFRRPPIPSNTIFHENGVSFVTNDKISPFPDNVQKQFGNKPASHEIEADHYFTPDFHSNEFPSSNERSKDYRNDFQLGSHSAEFKESPRDPSLTEIWDLREKMPKKFKDHVPKPMPPPKGPVFGPNDDRDAPNHQSVPLTSLVAQSHSYNYNSFNHENPDEYHDASHFTHAFNPEEIVKPPTKKPPKGPVFGTIETNIKESMEQGEFLKNDGFKHIFESNNQATHPVHLPGSHEISDGRGQQPVPSPPSSSIVLSSHENHPFHELRPDQGFSHSTEVHYSGHQPPKYEFGSQPKLRPTLKNLIRHHIPDDPIQSIPQRVNPNIPSDQNIFHQEQQSVNHLQSSHEVPLPHNSVESYPFNNEVDGEPENIFSQVRPLSPHQDINHLSINNDIDGNLQGTPDFPVNNQFRQAGRNRGVHSQENIIITKDGPVSVEVVKDKQPDMSIAPSPADNYGFENQGAIPYGHRLQNSQPAPPIHQIHHDILPKPVKSYEVMSPVGVALDPEDWIKQNGINFTTPESSNLNSYVHSISAEPDYEPAHPPLPRRVPGGEIINSAELMISNPSASDNTASVNTFLGPIHPPPPSSQTSYRTYDIMDNGVKFYKNKPPPLAQFSPTKFSPTGTYSADTPKDVVVHTETDYMPGGASGPHQGFEELLNIAKSKAPSQSSGLLPSAPSAEEDDESKNSTSASKKKLPFSKVPYVLMFPEIIPEEAMRPAPPKLLTKEIPVVQASNLKPKEFTPDGKPVLGPGVTTVTVHPRHQMYQVLASAHYEKMMEEYTESRKKPPSAIYTPYGVLVPVGPSARKDRPPANPASSPAVSSSPTAPSGSEAHPGIPRKKFKNQYLLDVLLGHSNPFLGHLELHKNAKINKGRLKHSFNFKANFEPAMDLLAEKLAIKLSAVDYLLKQPIKAEIHKFATHKGSYSENKPVTAHQDGSQVRNSGSYTNIKIPKSKPEQDDSGNIVVPMSSSLIVDKKEMTPVKKLYYNRKRKMKPEKMKEVIKKALEERLYEILEDFEASNSSSKDLSFSSANIMPKRIDTQRNTFRIPIPPRKSLTPESSSVVSQVNLVPVRMVNSMQDNDNSNFVTRLGSSFIKNTGTSRFFNSLKRLVPFNLLGKPEPEVRAAAILSKLADKNVNKTFHISNASFSKKSPIFSNRFGQPFKRTVLEEVKPKKFHRIQSKVNDARSRKAYSMIKQNTVKNVPKARDDSSKELRDWLELVFQKTSSPLTSVEKKSLIEKFPSATSSPRKQKKSSYRARQISELRTTPKQAIEEVSPAPFLTSSSSSRSFTTTVNPLDFESNGFKFKTSPLMQRDAGWSNDWTPMSSPFRHTAFEQLLSNVIPSSLDEKKNV